MRWLCWRIPETGAAAERQTQHHGLAGQNTAKLIESTGHPEVSPRIQWDDAGGTGEHVYTGGCTWERCLAITAESKDNAAPGGGHDRKFGNKWRTPFAS